MKAINNRILQWVDLGWAVLTLLFLLVYTYAFFFAFPYVGFEVSAPDTNIAFVFSSQMGEDALQVGDDILSLQGDPLIDRILNYKEPLYPDVHAGDILPLTVQRGDQTFNLDWIVTGPSILEITRRLLRPWYLAYIYWGFGVLTALLVRPRDERMQLMVSFNFIGAMWIIAGVTSPSHTWHASGALHAISWLLVWVTIYFNWIYPRSLWRIKRTSFWILFAVCIIMAAAEALYLTPNFLYLIPIALAGFGTLGLLTARFVIFPEQRKELRLLPLTVVIVLTLGIIGSLSAYPSGFSFISDLTLIFLSLLPIAYFYAVYKKHLGGLELRINSLIGIAVFVAVLSVVSVLLNTVANAWTRGEAIVITGLVTSILIGLAAVLFYLPFQNWFEQRFLGVPAPKADLLSRYSARLLGSLEYEKLYELLQTQVFPSLQVRQAALVLLASDKDPDVDWEVIPGFSIQVEPEQLPLPGDIQNLINQAGKIRTFLPLIEITQPCPWAKVVLTLVVEGKLIGVCLLGRRDPDDYYAPNEISTLQTLMDQTALALANIEKASHLRAFYQSDIQAQEYERSQLARELHDEVLAQMTLIRQGVDETLAGDQFNQAYQNAVQNIRGMIGGLRPAALNYGLQTALRDCADELRETSEVKSSGIKITLDFEGNSHRYGSDVELHMYRIIQQACRNSMAHARPRSIVIVGNFKEDEVELVVQDDGVGFSSFHSSDLVKLLDSQHYGLVGMYERAALIKANLTIESSPESGTQVRVRWQKLKSS